MNLLIVPDIFGPTPAVAALAEDLKAGLKKFPRPANGKASGSRGLDVIEILDTYGNGAWFKDEARAYAYFTEHLGVSAYAGTMGRHLAEIPGPCVVLAFSAGASALWHLAGTGSCPGMADALCFYGSQIRHDSHLVPGLDIHLIFPESEPHFDVDGLMEALETKPGTSCEKALGRHGFMNALSKNFDAGLYDYYVREAIPKRVLACASQYSPPGE